jgi:hypothetical protein
MPLVSADDWEGTRTVTDFPFQSRAWYVVAAPLTDTIVALDALDGGGAALLAQPIAVATHRTLSVIMRGREDW